MTVGSYNQFCPVAMAAEILCTRWTVVLMRELLAGSTMGGAAIGVAFGMGRAAMPLASGWVDRPSRLTSFHVRLAQLARPVHIGSAVFVLCVAGLAALGA